MLSHSNHNVILTPAEWEATRAVASPPAIEMRELQKRYRTVTAVAGLTMTVPRGEVFGFLGPNGAGKTTAVKLLLGLVRQTSGKAYVLGAPVGDRATRGKIGYLPELFRYQDWLSAREVLQFHSDLIGMEKSERRAAIDHVLDLVGLTGRTNDRVGTFSKGMQQRLGLAVALLGEPELVFLDEPTSALDPVGRHDVREIIRGLKQRRVTVFLNSHLLSEVEQVCDRVAIVDHGRVVMQGSLDDLIGAGESVRMHVTGLTMSGELALRRFGRMDVEGQWLTFYGVDDDAVPAIVAEIVRSGGNVYSVEPRHQSLEDRFLQLLGGGHVENTGDSPTHAA